MSQSDPNQQTRTNPSAGKPSVAQSPPKASDKKRQTTGGFQKFWYTIPVFILVAVIVVSYWVRKGGEGPPPVVSAAEESERVVDEEVIIEPESAPTTGALTITSDVRGADVYLNGKRVGKTPHKATPLVPGNYDVRVVHAGYETFEERVRVDTESHSIHADLPSTGVESNVREEEVAVHEEEGAVPREEGVAAPVDIRGLGETVAVKHRHRVIVRSCEGVLSVSAEGVRYDSDHKDAFFVALSDVEYLRLDKDKLILKVRGGRKYDFTERNDSEGALAAFHERVGQVLATMESTN